MRSTWTAVPFQVKFSVLVKCSKDCPGGDATLKHPGALRQETPTFEQLQWVYESLTRHAEEVGKFKGVPVLPFGDIIVTVACEKVNIILIDMI
jgi:hypothetical protein